MKSTQTRQFVDLDARGLEPPLPLIRILEAVEVLPLNSTLRARTERRPVHLFAHLEERGFDASTQEEEDGSCTTIITRR